MSARQSTKPPRFLPLRRAQCVFCWRHHRNPVGTTWRWKIDDPVAIVDAAVAQHVAMIHSLRGLPGVLPERWTDAHTVRHCALSLVGEPIMYPRVNELVRVAAGGEGCVFVGVSRGCLIHACEVGFVFVILMGIDAETAPVLQAPPPPPPTPRPSAQVAELHRRRISTFLVTNAQFPDAIRSLGPVTQLYVSIDAGNRDTLRAIDRPLFANFWERFLACLDALRDKGQVGAAKWGGVCEGGTTVTDCHLPPDC